MLKESISISNLAGFASGCAEAENRTHDAWQEIEKVWKEIIKTTPLCEIVYEENIFAILLENSSLGIGVRSGGSGGALAPLEFGQLVIFRAI